MADAVKLSSLRVTSDLDAGKYVQGAEAITAANDQMSASGKEVAATVTTTQTKVNGAGDIWTRLSRQYVDGAGNAQKLSNALRTLQRGMDTGNVSMAQAEQILDGLYKKLGLLADADELAANGQKDLAAAVTTVNARIKEAAGANDNMANKVGLNRVQMQMLTHEGKAMFDMLAAGASPTRALSLELPNLVSALSMGEGGLAGSLAALSEVALPIIAALAAMAIGVAGLTSAIDQNTHKSVSWLDTLKAIFQSLGDAVKVPLVAVGSWISGWFGKFVDWISPGVKAAFNFLVGGFRTVADDIHSIFTALPSLIGDGIMQAMNAISAAITGLLQNIAGRVNSLIDQMNGTLHTSLGKIDLDSLGQKQLDNPFQDEPGRLMQELAANGQRDMAPDYAGMAFSDIQRHALENAANDNKKKSGSRGQSFDDIVSGARSETDALKAQIAALGQSSEQTAYLEEKQKLLNQAIRDHIKLSPTQLDAIDKAARDYAEAKTQLESLTEAYNLGKQATEDFFSTFRQDLMNGTGLWQSFGDAASKVLDDIADKALQMAADGIWDMIWNGGKSSSSSSGGLGSVLGSVISGLFGHNAGGTDNWRGGLTWVGEQGPELVNLPTGSQVFSNPASMAMMGANSTAPASFAPAANNNGTLYVEVGISADNNGNLMPFVTKVSGQVAGQTVAPVAKAVSRMSQSTRFG